MNDLASMKNCPVGVGVGVGGGLKAGQNSSRGITYSMKTYRKPSEQLLIGGHSIT